ncbi:MAG: PTS sugar transporter subunit IIA [Deltaproteobacteria bacterium]|nr:PTS sugar transporter subunit IIA [Deltaproteobacteria bacterium]MBW2392865.1 PTS sugar transporter subunit IIA [Deltaproteobacteria bacterium]
MLLATVLVVGTLLGWAAQRLGLPTVTGQIVAGVVLGPSILDLFDEESIAGLAPLTHFALALIGVTVGAHLNVRRLRNAGRRLLWLLVAEAVITPLVVAGLILSLTEATSLVAILLATLAVSTAPATVIALVRETRSKGVFVKTLVAAVAINNMSCIFLFEVARTAGRAMGGEGELLAVPALEIVAASLSQIGQACLVGAGMAMLHHVLTLRVLRSERITTLSVVTLLLTFGLASYASVSPLAACLALGVVQTNLNPSRDRLVDSVFADFEPVILCVFFTLAGLHLSLDHAAAGGLVALVFVLARSAGKLLSASAAMSLAGATARVRNNLGMALLPQAGIAVGLVILIQDDPAFAATSELFTAVVLTAVTLNEIVGPITTRIALRRSGETGQDRARLVDFLQEENIVTGLRADSMEDAIGQMVDLLISSHHLVGVDREELRRSVLEREAQVSTCLGEGLAVPHGVLPEGHGMLGVMGLSAQGLPFPTPDGRPVHCVVLLATPSGERDRHLEVLAALARTLGGDPVMRQQLYYVDTPAHACEILHGEDTEMFNYFLGED